MLKTYLQTQVAKILKIPRFQVDIQQPLKYLD